MATMVARKLPSRICLSGKEKKEQFGEYGLRAYLDRYNVNSAKTSFSFLTDKLVELCTNSVFSVGIWSVFLRYYQYHTEGKLGQYFRYQKFRGSPSKNWWEPPFS